MVSGYLKGVQAAFSGFFVPVPHTCPFMVGLLGASSGAPVSFEAGKTNPDNPASRFDIGLSSGGSKLSKEPYHGLPHCRSQW
ncbi:MAG: ash family protein [Endozoicomonas sp.]|uniref:ash family protein n=1 Tax=Endozoicomonas sp. TaxID=1892382 RepID=UPI003D9ACF1B